MSNKLLNEEELAALKASPYVMSASCRTVTFTPEFKKKAYRELLGGKNIREILEAHGINTAALGPVRVNGLLERIRRESDRDEGFANLRHQKRKKTEDERNQSAERRIRQLETELAYMRQEVEFLKKVQAVDTEARKAWESKHRPK